MNVGGNSKNVQIIIDQKKTFWRKITIFKLKKLRFVKLLFTILDFENFQQILNLSQENSKYY